MNDTVTKILELADTYADSPFIDDSESDKRYRRTARQALQDELVRLFTPLTDEQIYTVVRSVQPDLSDASPAWKQLFDQCKYWIHAAQTLSADNKCNQHPKAPHGFNRNASHSAHRYVCDCESWEPYDAGYNDGFHAGMKAEQALCELSDQTQEIENGITGEKNEPT